MKALVLAAGKGERLRPLTENCPKPLLPFLGLPILSHALWNLKQQGKAFEALAVNSRYLPAHIAKFQKQSKIPFHLSAEPKILGIGGAVDYIRQTKWLGKDDSLLIYNGDVISDIDVGALIRRHQETNSMATCTFLPLREGTNPCDVKDGYLESIGKTGDYTFAGVYILSSAFIRKIPEGASDIVKTIKSVIKESPQQIAAYVHEGIWFDVGTPKAFAESQLSVVTDESAYNQLKIKEKLDFFGMEWILGEQYFTLGRQTIPKEKILGPVVINAEIDVSKLDKLQLSHTVIMPETRLDNSKLSRQLCGSWGCLGF